MNASMIFLKPETLAAIVAETKEALEEATRDMIAAKTYAAMQESNTMVKEISEFRNAAWETLADLVGDDETATEIIEAVEKEAQEESSSNDDENAREIAEVEKLMDYYTALNLSEEILEFIASDLEDVENPTQTQHWTWMALDMILEYKAMERESRNK